MIFDNIPTENSNNPVKSGGVKTYVDSALAGKQDTLVSGENIKTVNGQSIVGAGNVVIPTGLSTAYEIVDAGMLYLDQTETYYEVPVTVYTALKAVWDAGKVPVLTGDLFRHTTSFALIPTYLTDSFFCFYHGTNTMSGNRWHLSGRLFAGVGGQLYPEEEQELLVSGTNIKTIDGTSLLGSGDIAVGVQEINVSATITGSTPSNYVFTINNYADFYNAIVAAKTAGKIPISRMVVAVGNWTITLVGLISNKTQTTFTTSFQDSETGIYMCEFNSPSASTPYKIEYVEQQEKLVSGTNIKTINNTSLLGSGNIVCQEKLVSGINIKTINGNSIVGHGNMTIESGLQSFEFIECNITAVDGSDVATVSNNNWYTNAITAYEAKKIPVIYGQAISSGTKYSMILTVEKYNSGGDDYRIYGSSAITIGGSSPRRNILYAEMQSTHSTASIYISDFVNKITVDQTVIAGSTNPVSSAGVKTYVDGVVGNIDTILDQINGEVI